MLSPWHVYRTGIGAPSANAGLVIVTGSAPGAAVVGLALVAVGPGGDCERSRPTTPSLQPVNTTSMASPAMADAMC
jgi:hypothetical protein